MLLENKTPPKHWVSRFDPESFKERQRKRVMLAERHQRIVNMGRLK